MIPLLLMVLIAAIVVYTQVPQVESWVDRSVAPNAWRATEACRRAALATSDEPAFARILTRGRAHDTQEGYYVDRVMVGEMGEDGAEVRNVFSCYVDKDGNVVNTFHKPDDGVMADPKPRWPRPDQ